MDEPSNAAPPPEDPAGTREHDERADSSSTRSRRRRRRPRSKPLATLVVFIASIAFVVLGYYVTIPGVDLTEFIALIGPAAPPLRRALGAWQTRETASPILSVISTLVLVRLFVAIATRPRRKPSAGKSESMPFPPPADSTADRERVRRLAERIGGIVYLVLVAISGLGIALYLQNLHGRDPISLIVPNPDLGFQLRAVALYVACGCAVWMVSNAITRTRVVHGPIALTGALGVVRGTIELLDAGASASGGQIWPREALAPLVPVLPAAMLCLFVSRRPRWLFEPDSVGIRAFSSFDLVIAPTALGLLVPSIVQAARIVAHSFTISVLPSKYIVATQCVSALALGIVVVRTPRRSRANAAWALSAPLVLATAFAIIVTGAVAAGGNAGDFVRRGLLFGGFRYRVWFGTNDTANAADLAEIHRRLSGTDLQATVDASSPGSVIMLLRSPRRISVRVVDRLLGQGHLEIGWLGNHAHPLDAMPGLPAPSAAEARQRTAGFEPGPGLRVVIDCNATDPGGPGRACAAYVLQTPPLLAQSDVANAQAMLHADTGTPYVALMLTDEGGARFGEATTEGIGRTLAVVVDDEIVIRPVVREPITDGRVQISLDRDAQWEDAAQIVAMFGGELRGNWFVERFLTLE